MTGRNLRNLTPEEQERFGLTGYLGDALASTAKVSTYAELRDVLSRLGTLVRDERRRRGISLRQAEAETGVSNARLCQLENGGTANVTTALALLAWLDGTSA